MASHLKCSIVKDLETNEWYLIEFPRGLLNRTTYFKSMITKICKQPKVIEDNKLISTMMSTYKDKKLKIIKWGYDENAFERAKIITSESGFSKIGDRENEVRDAIRNQTKGTR